MKIAVLALQGAFAEHEQMLHQLGVETFEVRQFSDWQQPKDGLIIPGGESTTQSKILHELGLFEVIRKDIQNGLPVFGTCAGLILLSPMHLGTMDIEVRRNAYGRQLGSFHTVAPVSGIGEDIPMTFIRAPYIEQVLSADCQILAQVDGHIVAAQQGRQLVSAFHPELDNDTRFHQHFLQMIRLQSA
ncbi:MAG: pyridoxal 5'-phosphate synthase glutaminase subunit PdxT [Bacteroidales bacterium]|nr:pyridoxal 5'-phosphate synthase glutaminase subunit PdxT [Bacteroidales bacterium]